MRILLTGGAGYIGMHTAILLDAAGHNIIILDDFSNSNRGNLKILNRLIGKDLISIDCDIKNSAKVRKHLKENNIEAVVHFAGLKSVSESVTKTIDYYDNNVGGTISLLKAMDAEDIHKLIFSSSATVYGEPKYLPIDEKHPVSAMNPYGRTKLHVEEMLKDISRSGKDWKIISLRYFNPVGAHSSGVIGEYPNGIPDNLMPYINMVASGELPHLNIFGDDYDTSDGTGVRDFIHVNDLAAGHVAAVSHLDTVSDGYDAFNLGTGVGYSVLELVRAFEIISKKHIELNFVGRRSGDVGACFSDPSKANDVLGWKAMESLESMCSSTWKFQCASKKTL
jgi:UDP-glucose 4-epimerase